MASIEVVMVWGVERMSRASRWGGWAWTCRRMIDAGIEESRRENKGRVHRLNCDAPGPNGRKASRNEMSTRHALNEGRIRSKNRTGQDDAD
ncbi:hypothetical protein CO683_03180 [Bradyrhizobium ottawaense]|nr:hypothetical protein CO683_03180 [Bradyrhizobium ottawaense]